MSTTRPAAAARIGVPVGTPMSMPGWQDSQARDSQNGEVIGPLTGQIRPPEPWRIGPAGPVAGAPAARAAAVLLALERGDVVLEVMALGAGARERAGLVGPGALRDLLALDELPLDADDLVAALLDRERDRLRLLLE